MPRLSLRRRLLYPFNYENKCILQTNTTLHPDVSFETSANHRLTDEVILFIHTLNIISLHDTFMQYIFHCNDIFSSVNSIISPSTLYWSLSMPYGMKYVVTIERISSFWILLVMDEYKSISSIVRLSIAPSSPSLASAISCFLSFCLNQLYLMF